MKTDWKKGAVDRRDARAAKDEPVVRPSPRIDLSTRNNQAATILAGRKAKKNTKKWCRGKVGTEHQTVCLVYSEAKNTDPRLDFYHAWRMLACSVCGKELDSYHPLGFVGLEDRPKPEWVDK